jgi:hypothetical protein
MGREWTESTELELKRQKTVNSRCALHIFGYVLELTVPRVALTIG